MEIREQVEIPTHKINMLKGHKCDVCGIEIKEANYTEHDEMIRIDTIGGYNSIFGDGASIKLDMCQKCFKKKLGKYIRIVQKGDC